MTTRQKKAREERAKRIAALAKRIAMGRSRRGR
jgi:hypothetical protein